MSYRLLPASGHLLAFLGVSDGATKEDVFRRLPFEPARSSSGGGRPNPRRYRDARQLYETAGFLYEKAGRVRFTEFGLALKRFQPSLNDANWVLLAKHAACALSACQLRNPTQWGSRYDSVMKVFPNQFIWRVMLELNLFINAEELDRAIFRVRSVDDLREAVAKIRRYRASRNADDLGAPTSTGTNRTAGISARMSVASFGWTLILDRNESEIPGYYQIPAQSVRLLESAAAIPWPHRDFADEEAYMRRISEASFLPQDMR